MTFVTVFPRQKGVELLYEQRNVRQEQRRIETARGGRRTLNDVQGYS